MRVIATEAESLVQLSPRERQVLRKLSHGATNKAIAFALLISVSTVKGHVANMTGALGLANRCQLCLWAVTHPKCIQGVAVSKTLVLPFEAAA